MPAASVRIIGLQEFRAELKAVEAKLPTELGRAAKKAADIVAKDTVASFSSRGGVAPKVAPSVRTFTQQGGGGVRIGGDQFPYAMGSEFGSVRFKQFPAWRGSGAGAGYSLWPSIRMDIGQVEEEFRRALDDLVAKAFPN